MNDELQEDIAIARMQILMWSVAVLLAAVAVITLTETVSAAAEAWSAAPSVFDGVEAVIASIGLAAIAGGLPVVAFLFWRSRLGRAAAAIWAPLALAVLAGPVWERLAPAPQAVTALPDAPPVVKAVAPAKPQRSLKTIEAELADAIARVDSNDWWESNGCKTPRTTFVESFCAKVNARRAELEAAKEGAVLPASLSFVSEPDKPQAPQRRPRSLVWALFLKLAQLCGPVFCVACLMTALAAWREEQAALPAPEAPAAPPAPEGALHGAAGLDPTKAVRGWFRQCVQPDAGGAVSIEALYRDYAAYCGQAGAAPLGARDFVTGLAAALAGVDGGRIEFEAGICQGVRLGA
jgi:hypothetical protein